MLALGGSFALVLRTHLLTPTGALMDSYAYNRTFTMHGIVMVWLFMIPSIPAAFGNFLLPIMIGAKDVAFPRLNLLSYYIYRLVRRICG
jgi:cytochrome c oxidase subunit 1